MTARDPRPEALELPSEDGEPVFAEPWQAQAFALVVALHRQGRFAWREWVDTLVAEIRASPARPGESANDAYFRQWQAALEHIVTRKGLTEPEALDARTEAWRQAYLRTPHGRPVELAAAERKA